MVSMGASAQKEGPSMAKNSIVISTSEKRKGQHRRLMTHTNEDFMAMFNLENKRGQDPTHHRPMSGAVSSKVTTQGNSTLSVKKHGSSSLETIKERVPVQGESIKSKLQHKRDNLLKKATSIDKPIVPASSNQT